MAKQISPTKLASLIFSILTLCFAVVSLSSAAWNTPTLNPPDGDAPPPLNVSSVYQQKIGPLVINTGAAASGLLIPFGNVAVGTLSPSADFQVVQPTTGPGTVSNTAGGITITGVGTQFLNTFKVGDTITVGGQTVAITAITSNTSMTTDPITNSNNAVAYTLTGGTRFSVFGNGNIGIARTSPDGRLSIVESADGANILTLNRYNNNQQYLGFSETSGGSIITGHSLTTSPKALYINATTDILNSPASGTATPNMYLQTLGQNSLSIVNKKVRIGTVYSEPTSLFTVGDQNEFQVNTTGNLVRINKVAYSWPTANATVSGMVLTSSTTGSLSWGSSTLSNLTQGTGITAFSYNGTSAKTVGLTNTGVLAGTYGNATNVAQFTVDAQGRLTLAGNVPITPPTLANLTQGTGITAFSYNGTSAKTIGLTNTGVLAGTYGNATNVPQFTVDAQGRLTLAGNIPILTGVTSVKNTDGSLTINPTAGNVIASLNTNHSNTWTAAQTFSTVTNFPTGVWDAQGNVGIGVAAVNTGTKLQVNPPSYSIGLQVVLPYSHPYAGINIQDTNSAGVHSDVFNVKQDGDLNVIKKVGYSWPSSYVGGNTYLQNNGSGALSWSPIPGYWTANGNDIYNSNSGFVGIGTTTPKNLFTVHTKTNENVGIGDVNGGTRIGTFNDAGTAYTPLKIEASTLSLNTDSGGNVFIATGGGKVGVGVTALNYAKLQINPPAGTEGLRIITATDYSPFNIKNNGNNDIFRVDQSGILQVGQIPWTRLTNFPSSCSSGYYVSGVGGTLTCTQLPSSTINGTQNYVAKFATNTTLGNSIIFDNGSAVGVGTNNPKNLFTVHTDTDENVGIGYINSGTRIGTFNNAGTAYTPLKIEASTLSLNKDNNGNILLANGGGKVGIGTASPIAGAILHVAGVGLFSNVKKNELVVDSTGTNYAAFYDPGANNMLNLGGTASLATNPSTSIMSWGLSSGNVGIGITADSVLGGAKLTIAADSNNLLFANRAGAGKWYEYLSGDDLRFWENSANKDRLTLQAGGYVGIGTTTPKNLFTVHTNTNENIGIDYINGGSRIGTFNDAGTAYIPLKIEASTLSLNGNSGGNVGIGTTTPNNPLNVEANFAGYAAYIHNSNSPNTAGGLKIETSSTAVKSLMVSNGGAEHFWVTGQGITTANDGLVIPACKSNPSAASQLGALWLIDSGGHVCP